MDPIKEAFTKAKQDILNLQSQIESLKQELQSLKRTLSSVSPTDSSSNSAIQHLDPAHPETPTDNLPLYSPKTSFSPISTGNRGVPTDRQTNQQTDQHISNSSFNPPSTFPQSASEQLDNSPENKLISFPVKTDKISQIARVSDILSSLDSIKKEIRSNFKHLTSQEMLIFSTIYQLEEEQITVDYSTLARKLLLSESSMRDYVQKIIKKGIPIEKKKENNKKVILSISQNLKKIASLQTILTLREL